MKINLKRYKPSLTPLLYPIPEYLADEQLKLIYNETKQYLQVPWMGVVTMAFAHYPLFFKTLWNGIKDIVSSQEFIFACKELREFTEESVKDLEPELILNQLETKGYAQQEIENILELNEIFSHGNMPYIIIATIARLLLEGNEISKKSSYNKFKGWHGPSTENKLTLLEQHHVDKDTFNTFELIKDKIGLPFLNTDYRAFARWPTYFNCAWKGLNNKVQTDLYEKQVSLVHHFAIEKALSLPNPASLTSKKLIMACEQKYQLKEIKEVVSLFQWLLPGLAINVSYFRAQLVEENFRNV